MSQVLAYFSGVIGTVLGGILSLFVKAPDRKLSACLMHFTGGLMLAVVCFELLPEALYLTLWPSVAGMFTGIALMFFSDAALSQKTQTQSASKRAGLMVGLGIALHNLPEGLAVGAGFADAPELGMALLCTIALHDIPEGLGMALPLRAAKTSPARIVWLTFLAGLPTAFGVLIGLYAGAVSHGAIAFCLALAGGAMLQITCQNLLPEAQREGQGRAESLLMVLGILTGGAVCYFL